MERERVKDAEAIQNTNYEKVIRHYQEWDERQRKGKLLIRGDDLEYQTSRQGFLKYFLNPTFTDTALSSWAVFENVIKRQTGRHRHQGGIVIFVLEGEGVTEVNGEALEWSSGDLLLLPITPGGCLHQHWNKDVSKGCRWVAFRDLMMARYLANGIEQVTEMDQIVEMPVVRGGSTDKATGYRHKDWRAKLSGEQVPLVTSPDELAGINLFDRLIALRNLQRQRRARGTWQIRGDELPWELNAHGRMQWYVHPCLAYTAVQNQLFYRQEIPQGSRSGVQRHGGDAVFYITEGEGYTEVDGVRHNWKAGDVMTLPSFAQGVIYRHVNTGAGRVRLVCTERNLVHTVDVDRQSGFEELQPCPEYREAQMK